MSTTTNDESDSMTLDQFVQAIRRQPFRPFRPFRLILTDGRSFTIDHAEFISIDRRGREVVFHALDGTQHLLDARLIAEVVLAPPAEEPVAPETRS